MGMNVYAAAIAKAWNCDDGDTKKLVADTLNRVFAKKHMDAIQNDKEIKNNKPHDKWAQGCADRLSDECEMEQLPCGQKALNSILYDALYGETEELQGTFLIEDDYFDNLD